MWVIPHGACGDQARWTALCGSPDARIEAVMMGWWDALLAASDRDDRVGLDDVLVVVDRLGEMPDAMAGTVDAMFDVVDEDGDGSVSRDEFAVHRTEFWAGDDPNAPGTWLFGRSELPAVAG